MAADIVVFGATGYTGRLVVEMLVQQGQRPVLAGRSMSKLQQLASYWGDLEYRIADVVQPASVRDIIKQGDVLISTVGPFARFGDPALQAALHQGAHYLDSTGEPGFIRHVFEDYGVSAAHSNLVFLPSFGYDYVPGSLAAGLALQKAGEEATRVDVGYFVAGGGAFGMSQGTLASIAGAMLEPGLLWRKHRLREGYGGTGMRHFHLNGKTAAAISLPGTEHIVLPRSFPHLNDVNVYLGWFGGLAYLMPVLSRLQAQLLKIRPFKKGLKGLVAKIGSDGRGPSQDERERSRSHIIAQAYDSHGRELARVDLKGVNGYTYTAGILAWAAQHLRDHGVDKHGALGPIEAFGLEALQQGNERAGMQVV